MIRDSSISCLLNLEVDIKARKEIVLSFQIVENHMHIKCCIRLIMVYSSTQSPEKCLF